MKQWKKSDILKLWLSIRIWFTGLLSMTAETPMTQRTLCRQFFMKLYQKNPEFDSEEHLKHWLVHVTVNECKRLIASPWKKRMDFCQEEEEKEQGQAGAEGYERIREKELLEQIFRLPRKYRVPIYLYYYEEYSVADIGDMLGKSPSTIQTWLSRARKKLKKLLEEVKYYE